ncbi:MAG: hypothetical protein COB84_10400 [Rhodobacteraceae bacterium]|nr:MAG: hypothetical protein COB84_10400 [Paracoccaceae bacterium]
MQTRAPKNHFIIIDGTQSRLDEGHETNAGILYKLLKEKHDPKTGSLWYDAGIQGHGLWNWATIASGLGINRTIRDAYAYLSTKYQTGDKIYLFGYSRGAYAVRSLAGMINNLGLLRKDKAIERLVRRAFTLYEFQSSPARMQTFSNANCRTDAVIEMVGVWDTVKALGLPYPLLCRLAPMATEFHNDRIGNPVRNGFQALALNETRTAYCPVLWHTDTHWTGHLEQVWFRGAHSDIGGHVWRDAKSRKLSNIPLVWMLERSELCGVKLPEGWRDRFPCDPHAPMIGSTRGIAKFFLFRKPRVRGKHPNEYVHHTVLEQNPDFKTALPIQNPAKT